MRHNEAYYTENLAASGIPDYMHGGIVRYLMHGIPPGSFLVAVLTNDLKEAVNRGDETNLLALADYVRFFYNHAPVSAWGSVERVEEWAKARQLERA